MDGIMESPRAIKFHWHNSLREGYTLTGSVYKAGNSTPHLASVDNLQWFKSTWAPSLDNTLLHVYRSDSGPIFDSDRYVYRIGRGMSVSDESFLLFHLRNSSDNVPDALTFTPQTE